MTEPPVTRDVILDLLPLYLADEVSEPTRQLVVYHLENDPKLAKLVQQTADSAHALHLPAERVKDLLKQPTEKEIEMQSFEKTKRFMFQQSFFMALAVFTSLLLIAFRFDSAGHVAWLWQDSPAIAWPMLIVAAVFWAAYFYAAHKVRN